MAKVFTLNGRVRGAEIARKKSDNSPYGTKVGVLSEPDGDTVEVLFFDRFLASADAMALRGLDVTLLVEVEPQGRYLNATCLKVLAVEAPAVAVAVAPPALDLGALPVAESSEPATV